MTAITAQMVKELRERTDAPMMECKKALTEANGDLAKAEEILRVRLGNKAAKASTRITAEGVVATYLSEDGKLAAMVELNCETDFVAKNEDFQAFAKQVAELVARHNPADLDALAQLPLEGKTVDEVRRELIGKIGENITIRRFVRIEAEGKVFPYIHGGSKIGVLLDLVGGGLLDRALLARLVLRPDIAAIDRKAAVAIQRHEYASAREFGRVVDQRPLFERFHRHLELTEPGIDLLGVFVLAGTLLFQRTILGEERSVGRAFLVGHRRGITDETPQTVAVAIGQVGRDLDPLPAFGSERFGFSLKLLGHQPIEKGRVLEPATVIALEEITQHDTARRLIGIDTHKDRAAIRRPDRSFRQHAPDGVGLFVPGALHRMPDLLLTRVIRVHRERHQLFERHAILGIYLEQGRDRSGEFEARLDDLRR